MYAARLWWMLRWLGHDAVGGARRRLRRSGRAKAAPVDDRGAGAPRRRRSRSARVAPTVERAGVAGEPRRAMRSLLLDARARERYRGEVEPLDPVAGHIPGALNRPYHAATSTPTARSSPPRALRAEFDALLAGRAAERRRPLLRVRRHRVPQPARDGRTRASAARGSIPGSWSEWCADPAAAGGARRRVA